MSEVNGHSRTSIPEEVMLARLAQSEQMREFFIQMWLQNPLLGKRLGNKLEGILSPTRRAGLCLPEIPLCRRAKRFPRHAEHCGPASADFLR